MYWLKPDEAVLTSDTAVLVAAERRVRAVAGGAVEPDEARAQPSCHRQRAVQRTRHHVSGQAVGAVVGDPDGVLLVLVGNDSEDGPEDLLLRDGHLVVDVSEKRWADPEALVELFRRLGAADEHCRALVDTLSDVTENARCCLAEMTGPQMVPGSCGSPAGMFS